MQTYENVSMSLGWRRRKGWTERIQLEANVASRSRDADAKGEWRLVGWKQGEREGWVRV